MAVLKVELLGSEVLRRRAEEVAGPDPELDRLIDDMFETMYEQKGIGLAAPQVGVSRRVIVVDVNEPDVEPFALYNPRVVEAGPQLDKMEEGCLSIPGVTGVVERPFAVTVEGLDRAGNPVRIEAEAMLARCLQHEIDHLDGVLFIDRLSPLKRNMVLRKYRKLAS
ncbi:MAG TPA: peptide deformylase [Longimicrobium sp.]|jgi:peptide deformylase